jgi:hypothetical protein
MMRFKIGYSCVWSNQGQAGEHIARTGEITNRPTHKIVRKLRKMPNYRPWHRPTWENTINVNLKQVVKMCNRLTKGSVVGSYKLNEPLASTKDGEFLGQLHYHQLLKKGSDPCSWLSVNITHSLREIQLELSNFLKCCLSHKNRQSLILTTLF